MILILIPIVITAFFSVIELNIPNQKRLQNQLYHIVFYTVFFIVGIKYYYGPDIHLYVPLYENIESPWYIWQNGSHIGKGIEIGYLYYCSIFKWIGCNFWLFTFSITCIYFYSIYQCFKHIENYRITALFALTVFEANILFFEFRQAIAVSLFILGILAFLEKKYIKYLLYIVISVFFHKSAIFVAILSFIVLFVPTIKYSRNYYLTLCLIIISGIFISFGDILTFLTTILPIPDTTINSISHHLDVENSFQIIFILYCITFVCLYQYSINTDNDKKRFYVLILSFFLIIAIFYKYWFFLNRVRSFFSPLIIVFIINELSRTKRRVKFIKQTLVIALFCFAFIYARGLYLVETKSKSKVLAATTLFSRINRTEAEIKKTNIDKAVLYFKKEYLKNNK